jgi:ankyrin repeat protein
VEKNPRSAYVASISGHTLFFVALLEKYMQHNKDSPTLNDDINHFLRGLAATYVSMGFHSILEVSHALETPMVKDICQKYNVAYAPTFSDKVLKQAFNDAQSYNSQILLRTAMREELINKSNIFSLITKGKFDETKTLITKCTDPNIRDDANNTPLHAIINSDEFSTEQKNDLIAALINKGADTNAINDIQRTPLMDAVNNNFDSDVAIGLLNKTSEICPRKDSNKPERNVFEHAMIFDNFDLAVKLLNTNKFNPNVSIEVYGEAFTPLIKAITAGGEGKDFFNALIQSEKIDVNKGVNGNIPIFLAIEENNLAALSALLDHPKTDLNIKNIVGITVLQFAKEMDNSEVIKLIEAAQNKLANQSNSDLQKNTLSPPSSLHPTEDLSSMITNHGPVRH